MDKTLDQRIAELEQRVAVLEEQGEPSACLGNSIESLVFEDEKALKRSVRKILQLMEDEKVELALYDDGEIYFETRGEKSGQLVKVKHPDMIRAFMY